MRFKDEQARIERWLRAVDDAAHRDLGLGLAVAQCAQLIKGYGDTHARALRNFRLIAETYFEACTDQHVSPAMLADLDGTALDAEVARFQAALAQTQAAGAAAIAAQ